MPSPTCDFKFQEPLCRTICCIPALVCFTCAVASGFTRERLPRPLRLRQRRPQQQPWHLLAQSLAQNSMFKAAGFFRLRLRHISLYHASCWDQDAAAGDRCFSAVRWAMQHGQLLSGNISVDVVLASEAEGVVPAKASMLTRSGTPACQHIRPLLTFRLARMSASRPSPLLRASSVVLVMHSLCSGAGPSSPAPNELLRRQSSKCRRLGLGCTQIEAAEATPDVCPVPCPSSSKPVAPAAPASPASPAPEEPAAPVTTAAPAPVAPAGCRATCLAESSMSTALVLSVVVRAKFCSRGRVLCTSQGCSPRRVLLLSRAVGNARWNSRASELVSWTFVHFEFCRLPGIPSLL